MTALSLELPDELAQRLENITASSNRPMPDQVTDIIAAWVDEAEQKWAAELHAKADAIADGTRQGVSIAEARELLDL